MDFYAIYHFLFETSVGVGVLVVGVLVISTVLCALWEVRTRKIYQDLGPSSDEWSIFEDSNKHHKS